MYKTSTLVSEGVGTIQLDGLHVHLVSGLDTPMSDVMALIRTVLMQTTSDPGQCGQVAVAPIGRPMVQPKSTQHGYTLTAHARNGKCVLLKKKGIANQQSFRFRCLTRIVIITMQVIGEELGIGRCRAIHHINKVRLYSAS